MPGQTPLKAGILIISDTAHADPTTDKAASVLQDVFAQSGTGQWEITNKQIVPDEKHQIQSTLEQWSDPSPSKESLKINLIVTTGGTGFATKDVTPEAVEPLLQRKAPGLVSVLHSLSSMT